MKRNLFFSATSLLLTSTLAPAQGSKQVGSVHRKAQTVNDRGLANPGQRINYVSVMLTRTPEQEAALEVLVNEQHDPQSPNFRHWLTPEQFGERFGANTKHLEKVFNWLTSNGLKIESTARGRDWIVCSGTVAQFQTAFHTEIHRYLSDSQDHFANATPLKVPAEMADLVMVVRGLNDFYPHARPDYTSSTGGHSLAPDDWAAIYDVLPLYAAGYSGAGQRLVVVGDYNILASDIATFRSTYGLSASPIEMHLVGTDPGVSPTSSEAVLDLEWSGAIARGATIVFDFSANLYDAVQDAIDNALGSVLSESFGGCEADDADLAYYSAVYALKANAEGMTWVAAAGDAGPAGCDSHDDSVAVNGISASFPATIPEVTAVGGTEFNEGTGNYWSSTNGATLASALGYIPEVTWNDPTKPNVTGLSSSGGGSSVLFSKPAWQVGPGVPSDGARDVPDIAFTASSHDAYRIVSGGNSTTTSGTSAATPSFAGVVAILNQYLVAKQVQSTPGLGNINPTIYSLWSTVPAAFHDITIGSNMVPCLIGSPDCATGTFGFYARPGYDLVTGVGSIDVNTLVTNWKAVAMPAVASNVVATVTPNPVLPTASNNYQVTILLKETNGGQTTLTNFSVNGTNDSSQIPSRFGSATIAAYGSIGASITYSFNSLPASNVYTFGGTDPSGKTWTQTVTVKFLAAAPESSVNVTVNPNPVYQTPATNGNQWTFGIKLSETAGVATTLTGFSVNGVSYTSQLSSIFGGTSIAAKGTLSGTFGLNQISAPTTATLLFTGADASGRIWTQQVFLPLLGLQGSGPTISGVANGASFQTTFAPGMQISVFGSLLATSTAAAGAVPLPATLGGATVTIDGQSAPFYYASPSQLNVQIPYGVATGPASITVTVNALSSTYTFTVAATAPGIYVGSNSALVPTATAARGSVLSLYLTGSGAQMPAIATGGAPLPTTPLIALPVPVAAYSVTVGNVAAPIDFFGIPPYLVGVTQVNFTVPSNTPLGVQPVVVTVGGVASVAANITVTQ